LTAVFADWTGLRFGAGVAFLARFGAVLWPGALTGFVLADVFLGLGLGAAALMGDLATVVVLMMAQFLN
jgi:hypothetical protein